MKTKAWVLLTTALVPFGTSFLPTPYLLLVHYFRFTYPLSVFCGMMWMALFCIMYFRAEPRDRRKLLWYAPLAIFAFIVPVHMIILALGVPPFLPPNFTPS